MDDIAFIKNGLILNCLNHNKPFNDNDIYTLCPLDSLQIKPTFDTYSSSYLNIEITLINTVEGEFSTCTAWKKDKLPCQMVDFIQAWGNRPKAMSYKVCLSQVVPILYNASHLPWMTYKNLCLLFTRMVSKKSI